MLVLAPKRGLVAALRPSSMRGSVVMDGRAVAFDAAFVLDGRSPASETRYLD